MRNPPLGAPKAPARPRPTRSSAGSAFGAPFAKVPLAVLISVVPFAFSGFAGPAGADTVADCEAAFGGGTSSGLTYTTDPAERLAYTGQTVRLSGSWDPAAWDSLSSAVACVRVDDAFDEVLGASEAAPDNTGAFEHSFTIPEVDPGTRLCTKIRLAGDPAGEATDAVWVSKMHCFEVDHHEEEAPPAGDDVAPTTAAPSTTTSTVPATAGASSTPGPDAPVTPEVAAPVTPEAGGSPVGTPFDSAGDLPPSGSGAPRAAPTTPPESLPMLPATGYSSLDLLHRGELLFFTGLALMVLGRRPGRRQTA